MICKLVKNANKLLYVGAGHHIEPVIHFPNTKNFVFIDSQPRSEFDSFHPKFYSGFYREHFLNNLVASCQYYGFILNSFNVLDKNYYKNIITKKWYYSSWFYKIPADINPTMLVFYNHKTQQKLTYYVSTNIKYNMNKTLENDIATCDGIIVSGYFPEKEILSYFVSPKVFFGYTDTSYVLEYDTPSDLDNNILFFLHNYICNTQYYFTEFYMVCNNSGVIIKCQDFKHFVKTHEEYRKQKHQLEDNDDNTDSVNSLLVNDEY
jgi:hypothetical protein